MSRKRIDMASLSLHRRTLTAWSMHALLSGETCCDISMLASTFPFREGHFRRLHVPALRQQLLSKSIWGAALRQFSRQ